MTTTTTLTGNKCPNCGRSLYYYNDGSDTIFGEMGPTITKIVCPFCMSGWKVNSFTRRTFYQVAAVPMIQRGEKVNKASETNAKSAHIKAKEILKTYSNYNIIFSHPSKNIIEATHFSTGHSACAKKHPCDKYDETIGKAVALLRLFDRTDSEITDAIFG